MATSPSPTPSDLRSHLGFWLRLVSNKVSKTFAQRLEALDLTVVEWVVLREIHAAGGAVAPSVISRLTDLSRGAITKITDRLLAKALLSRCESTTDRRYQDIALTDAGRRMVGQAAVLADCNDDEFFGVLTRAEQQKLRTILRKIAVAQDLDQVPVD